MSDESRRGRGRARARARPPGSDEDPSHRPPPPPGMQGRGVAPPPGFDRSFAPSSSNEHSSILSDADVYSSSFSASFASMTLREGGRSGGSSPLTVHGAPLSNTSTSSKGFGASPFAFKSEETEGDSSQTGSRGQPSSRGSGPAFGAPPPGLPVPRGFYSGQDSVRQVVDDWQETKRSGTNNQKEEKDPASISYDAKRPDDPQRRGGGWAERGGGRGSFDDGERRGSLDDGERRGSFDDVERGERGRGRGFYDGGRGGRGGRGFGEGEGGRGERSGGDFGGRGERGGGRGFPDDGERGERGFFDEGERGGRKGQFGHFPSAPREKKWGRSESNDNWRRRDEKDDDLWERDDAEERKDDERGGWRKQLGVSADSSSLSVVDEFDPLKRTSPTEGSEKNEEDDDGFTQVQNKRSARGFEGEGEGGGGGRGGDQPSRGRGFEERGGRGGSGGRGRERGAFRGVPRGGRGGRGGRRPSEYERIFERLTLGGTVERPMSVKGDRDSLKELGTYVQFNVRGVNAAPKPESIIGAGMIPLDTLYANAFATTTPDYTLYQYVVDFDPIQENPRTRKQLVYDHIIDDHFEGSLQFDGMHGWSVYRIHRGEKTVLLRANPPAIKTDILIRIRLVGELPRDSPTVKQMQNILLRKAMAAMGEVQVGRNFYQPHLQRDVRDPNHRLVVWPGFETRIDLYDGGPLLVMDVSHKVLRTDTTMDCINEWAQEALRMEKDPNLHIKAQLVGSSVLTRYNNRHYRVDDIDFELCPLNEFEKDGERISYVEYFRDRWGLEVTRPEIQPLLIHRLKGSEKRSAEMRKAPTFMYLVPEFCFMTGLTSKQRTDFTLMRNMGEFTRPTPQARVSALLTFNKNLRTVDTAKNELEPWGLLFSPDLSKVEGAKQIPPETIIVGEDATIEPNPQGNPMEWVDWSRQMRNNVTLINAQHLQRWCILCPKRDMNDAQAFIQCLMRIGPPMGIKMAPPLQYDLPDNRVGSYIRALQDIKRDVADSCQLVMVFIPKSTELYNAVKIRLCKEMPTPSQCICVGKNLKDSRKAMSIATKVAIQMNVKLGGEAWAVSIPPNKGAECKLLVMGIDTYHDPRHREPSVVGVVASMNKALTKYLSVPLRQQTTKNEVAEALHSCMKTILEQFMMMNGNLPEYVCVFRDGVGEGQLQVVHDQEVKAIVDGLARVTNNANIKVAFTVVTKRVPQRFFHKTKSGQFVNPYPGTVADHVVTRPEYNDFFLISQSVNQGTVSPTHYNMIWDTTGWRVDIHQKLAYKLTHLYYNWQGTIKVPAPCQYAHKLAYLVGENLKSLPDQILSNKLYYL